MSHDTNEPDEILSPEDQDLEFTKDIRKRLIAATFQDGKAPGDKLEAQILLDSLNSIERISIAKKRIRSDERKNESTAALAVAIAKVIREEVDPSREGTGGGEIPAFPEEILSGFEVSPDETSDYVDKNYKEFKQENGLT